MGRFTGYVGIKRGVLMKKVIAIIMSILMLLQSGIIGQAKEYETENELEGIYTISTKLDSSKIFDVHEASTSSGARVELFQNGEGKHQQFVIRKLEDGYYSITAMHSNLLLTVVGNKVCQLDSTGNADQKWRIEENVDGSHTFYQADTTKCMDIPESKAVNGVGVDVFEYHGGNNQRFLLNKLQELPEENQPENGQPEDEQPNQPDNGDDDGGAKEPIEGLSSGIYTVSTKLDLSKCFDVHGASMESGARVELFKNGEGKHQQFSIRKLDDGYYSIEAMHSGLLLTAVGNKVCQSNPTGNVDQKWRIEKNVDGSYTFYVADTTKCMDIPESKAVNGAGVDVFEKHGGNNQKFVLNKLQELSEGNYPEIGQPEEKHPDNGNNDGEKDTIGGLESGIYTVSTKLDVSKCFDVHGASMESGARVELFKNGEGKHQQFAIRELDDGYYSIEAMHSGLVLTAVGNKVCQSNPTGSINQKWRIEKNDDGSYIFYLADTTKCMDIPESKAVNGAGVDVFGKHGGNNQKFILNKLQGIEEDAQPDTGEGADDREENMEVLEAGVYTISTKLDSSKCFDVHGASTESGARVELFKNGEGKHQQFVIRALEERYYSITAMHSGLLLTATGNQVCQSSLTESVNQKWRIENNSDGSYTFYLADTTKCMDIPESKAVNGVGVGVYENHGGNNQRFILNKLQEIPITINECKIEKETEKSICYLKIDAQSEYKHESADDKYYIVQVDSLNEIIEEDFQPISIEKNDTISEKVKLEVAEPEIGSILMSKYALAILDKDGEYQLVSDPVYISNPEAMAKNNAPIFKGTSKKGLQGIYYASYEGGYDIVDARNANTKHTLLNLDLASVVSTTQKEGYRAYLYKGNTYYFSELSNLKANVRSLNYGYKQYLYGNNDRTPVAVTLCLLLSYNSENNFLIDPVARSAGHAYYTLNVREERARETLEALFLYLGETFGQSDCYVSNWILGNEVNSSKAWNYSGSLDFDTYMECYATAFRLLYTGVKSEKTGNTVSISLDNGWTAAPDTYAGKTTLDTFAEKIYAQNSGIEWSIAYHPYSYPLTNVDFWNDYSNTIDSLSTRYISMRNIKVLTDYAGTLEGIYGKSAGSIRVLLTEQGYSYIEGAETQAEAIARGYYIAEFNDRIDAFIIRAVADDEDEAKGKLYFGLMNRLHEKRIAFYVYEHMDSDISKFVNINPVGYVSEANYGIFEKAQRIIRDTKWDTIVHGFDMTKLAKIK